MSKNNTKVISYDDMLFLNGKYDFEIDGSSILVKIKDYNRVTAHPVNNTFSLNTKVRKIDITPQAIRLWDSKYKNKHSLFEVQNAINILISTYQEPSDDDIDDQLKRGDAKIRIV